MTGRTLTLVELDERRRERDQVRHQLAQVAPLKRRLAHLERELLDGVAYPLPGASAEQLPLAAPLSQRVLEALRAAKARRSTDVLATLLGESSERVHEAIMELIAAGLARSARRGGYEATTKPETAPRTGRKVEAGKGQKKPAAEAPVLGAMTMGQVRQVLLDEIGTWKRWHSGAAVDHALWAELRKSGHDRGDGFDLGNRVDDVSQKALTALAKEGRIQCSEGPGNWNNSYAPLGVERTAEGGPDEPRPPRAKKASKKPATKKVAGPGKKAHAKAEKPSKKPATKRAKSPFLGKGLPENYLAGLATDAAAHMRQAGRNRMHLNELAKALDKTPAHVEAAMGQSGGALALQRERLTMNGSLQKLVYLRAAQEVAPAPAAEASR